MALIEVNYLSQALCKITALQVFIPNDLNPEEQNANPYYGREMRVLYLLHGYSGNQTDWIQGTTICNLAKKYNFAVVCPAGDNSFYLDQEMTGAKYAAFIGEELPSYMENLFGFSGRREDTYIGGFSMGGFGSIHTALKYNRKFSKAAAFSSALIINEIINTGSKTTGSLTNSFYQDHIFGPRESLKTSEKNHEYLLCQLLEKKERLPEFYLACGTEDFLLPHNREFRDFLKEKGVPAIYVEAPGGHDWDFWYSALTPAVQWMMEG